MEARRASAFTLAKKSVWIPAVNGAATASCAASSRSAIVPRRALKPTLPPSARALVLMSDLVRIANAEPPPAVVAAAGAASATVLLHKAAVAAKTFVPPPDGAASCALILARFGDAVRMTLADPKTMVPTANVTADVKWLVLSADGTRGVLAGALRSVNGAPRDATAPVYWRVAALGGHLLLPVLHPAIPELRVYECAHFLHFVHQPLRAPIPLCDGAPIEITCRYPGFEGAGLREPRNDADVRRYGVPVVCEVHLEGRTPIVLARKNGAVLVACADEVKLLPKWTGAARTRNPTELLDDDILCVAPSPNSSGDGGYHLPDQGDPGWAALLRLRCHAYVVGESLCTCCTGDARVVIAPAAPEAAASSSAGGTSSSTAGADSSSARPPEAMDVESVAESPAPKRPKPNTDPTSMEQ